MIEFKDTLENMKPFGGTDEEWNAKGPAERFADFKKSMFTSMIELEKARIVQEVLDELQQEYQELREAGESGEQVLKLERILKQHKRHV